VAAVTDTLLGATVYGGKVERLVDVLITGDVRSSFRSVPAITSRRWSRGPET
jgi:hypothetical protein